jgi:hypothetical protein
MKQFLKKSPTNVQAVQDFLQAKGYTFVDQMLQHNDDLDDWKNVWEKYSDLGGNRCPNGTRMRTPWAGPPPEFWSCGEAGTAAMKEFMKKNPTVEASPFHKPESSEDELKEQLNSIVNAHVQHRKQADQYAIQAHANMAFAAAEDRKQRRFSHGSQSEHASPSPAKSVSNIEIAHHAHLALSAAKARSTPAKSPPPSCHWEAFDEQEDFAPRQLNFAEGFEVSKVHHKWQEGMMAQRGAQREKELAMRRTAALEAWGASSPNAKPSCFEFQ